MARFTGCLCNFCERYSDGFYDVAILEGRGQKLGVLCQLRECTVVAWENGFEIEFAFRTWAAPFIPIVKWPASLRTPILGL